MQLYPFAQYWPFFLGFTGFVLAMLMLDLGVFHRKAHEVSLKEASLWSVTWIGLALLFNAGLFLHARHAFGEETAQRLGLEFLTGFVVEKALAVDNIFVFAMVFSAFAIPKVQQHRILFYGILGALVFRALFIAAASKLMAYQAVVVFFGVLLIVTGIKTVLAPSTGGDPEKSFVLRGLRRVFRVSRGDHGSRFLVREGGLLHVTPAFLALAFIEFSDVLFAVDSVPAIFAVTKEPFLVFTSNIFAILGLRSMYFLLAGVLDRFVYIRYGLGGVLVFVGLKMTVLNQLFGGHFPIMASLLVIFLLVGGSVLASLLWGERARPESPKQAA